MSFEQKTRPESNFGVRISSSGFSRSLGTCRAPFATRQRSSLRFVALYMTISGKDWPRKASSELPRLAARHLRTGPGKRQRETFPRHGRPRSNLLSTWRRMTRRRASSQPLPRTAPPPRATVAHRARRSARRQTTAASPSSCDCGPSLYSPLH